MDELMQQFVVEALELTQQAADDLAALERQPDDRSHIESAFRAFHTLKGSVGLFDLAPMLRALHAAEDVLSNANTGSTELAVERIRPLVDIVDWTERCIRQLAVTGKLEPDDDSTAGMLIGHLLGSAMEAERIPLFELATPDWAAALFELDASADAIALRYEPLAESFFNGDDPIALMSSLPGIIVATIATRRDWGDVQSFDPFQSNLIFEALSVAPRAAIDAAFRLLPDQVSIVARPRSRVAARASPSQSNRTVRVDMDRIDKLVESVGELFTAKNAMTNLIERARQLPGGMTLARAIAAAQQDFDRLTSELQRSAMTVRMVPLSETFRRLPRLTREVASLVGKTIDLSIEGGEIEADKSIVDGLYDPLLHVIRNAIDHGIEPTPEREAAQKPLRGNIKVRARQTGYRIELQVSDDGGGIDVERVRATAVARGIIDAAQSELLDDVGVNELLFRSGFSTAQGVTSVSGRGVGMDAIREAVERLGGRVAITSERGRGTTISLSLPTSFALTRVMVVDAGGDSFGLPMDVVSEMAKVPSDAITPVRAGEAFVLRNRTVPIVRLARLLGLPEVRRVDELVLVADTHGGAVGVVIDAVGERFEILLRPPTGLMKSVPGVSGTAVLGNGQVIMVLDLEALT